MQNSAQGTNVTNNQTQHIQNSAQHINVKKKKTRKEHIQNTARSTKV